MQASVQVLAQAAVEAAVPLMVRLALVQAAVPLLAMLLVRLALGWAAQVLPLSALPALPVAKLGAFSPWMTSLWKPWHLRQAQKLQAALLVQMEEWQVVQPWPPPSPSREAVGPQHLEPLAHLPQPWPVAVD